MKKTIVVNLFAGPGAGKTTGARYIFAMLKMARPELDFECADEYAKDKAWEGTIKKYNQFYLSGKQSWKIKRLNGKLDVIITDSPILLGAMYCKDNPMLIPAIKYEFNKYNNINLFIERHKEYNPHGRSQTEAEAKEIDNKILNFLKENNVQYKVVEGTLKGYDEVVQWLLSKLEDNR